MPKNQDGPWIRLVMIYKLLIVLAPFVAPTLAMLLDLELMDSHGVAMAGIRTPEDP